MKENRKRGARPGNQNARKHGLYSRIVTPEEVEAIKIVDQLDEHGRAVVFGYLLQRFLAEPDRRSEEKKLHRLRRAVTGYLERMQEMEIVCPVFVPERKNKSAGKGPVTKAARS